MVVLMLVYIDVEVISGVISEAESEAKETKVQAKLKYDKTLFSKANQVELWNLNYNHYDLVSGLNFFLIESEVWNVLIIFLYIGVTYVKIVNLGSVYISIVSLLDMALIKGFNISNGMKQLMLEIYCVSFLLTTILAKWG